MNKLFKWAYRPFFILSAFLRYNDEVMMKITGDNTAFAAYMQNYCDLRAWAQTPGLLAIRRQRLKTRIRTPVNSSD